MTALSRFMRTAPALALLLATAMLPACKEVAPPAKHAKAKPSARQAARGPWGADTYLLNLALARAVLSKDGAGRTQVQPYLDIVQEYNAQPPVGNPQQVVVILHYQVKKKKDAQQIVVPLSQDAGQVECAALDAVMPSLAALPYTLHDMRIAMLAVEPRPFDLASADLRQLRTILEGQQKRVVEGAIGLTPAEEAGTLLGIARCFIGNRTRDAAYLAIENAKQSLAAAAEHGTAEKDDIQRLSREEEKLEETLHETMPYTL